MSPTQSPSVSPNILLLRRLAMFVPAAIITLIGCSLAWQMMGDFTGTSNDVLDLLAFIAFSLLFAMLAFNSWAMFLGLGLWLGGRRTVPLEKEALAIPRKHLVPSLTTRTAVLVPAYHEDAHEVFSRVRAMHQSLSALQPAGSTSDVDIFVLSDSQNPSAIEAEAKAYRACIATLGKHGPSVFYRRRPNNTEYKVGNIKEFCTRWGHAYEHMLILDADSLMSGETIRRLITLLERHPRVGLLQTCFLPIGRDTLFCRIMQFSARLYLMPASMGLEFWQGPNGNYWGHNAIVRTRAFMETCGLPVLPGSAPLGGRILSHDIVEAAFIGRGGWEAWLLPNLPGTYEELPTNLIDFMQRDRRWCAGNLQHQHVIRAEGIPFGNRLHMILGIMSYASGPLWLGFILIALLGTLTSTSHTGLQLATAGFFTASNEGTMLFRLTMVLLFLPKLLTFLLAFVQPRIRKSFGGGINMLASAVLEQLFAMLQQPVAMLFYTTFVIMPLCGNVVRWEAQPRSERGINWREAFLRHRSHLLFAASLFLLLAALDKTSTMLGLLPVFIGLMVSPAFTVFTSRASLGQLARRCGLFLTVDELTPAPEVKTLQKLIAQPLPTVAHNLKLPRLPGTAYSPMITQLLRYPAPANQPIRRSYLALEKAMLILVLILNVGDSLAIQNNARHKYIQLDPYTFIASNTPVTHNPIMARHNLRS